MLLCVAQSVSAHTPSTWILVLAMLILMTKKRSLQNIFPNSACSNNPRIALHALSDLGLQTEAKTS